MADRAVDYYEFVRVWMDVYTSHGSNKDIEQRFGISPDVRSARQQTLRRRGVKLPLLIKRTTISNTDVDALNTIIREALHEPVPHRAVGRPRKEPPL